MDRLPLDGRLIPMNDLFIANNHNYDLCGDSMYHMTSLSLNFRDRKSPVSCYPMAVPAALLVHDGSL